MGEIAFDYIVKLEKEIDKLKLKNPMNQGERNNI